MENYDEIIQVDLADEMEQSYLDYAMSVITDRALVDVRDGMKPVNLRILYATKQLGIEYNKPHRKSARVVGEVIGRYHARGDASVYDAMVGLAQPFKMRLPLIDGQGNFGSVEGDAHAHQRYTETRLSYASKYMIDDVSDKIVDFRDNFDGSTKEPTVLPARIPNLLISGTSGIAVSIASKMPSHNPIESIDTVIEYLKKPDSTTEELLETLKGADFCTGGVITNKKDLLKVYQTGHGKIEIRGKAHEEIDKKSGRKFIVITEIPQTVSGNTGRLISKIVDLVNDNTLSEVVDLNDESKGMDFRIVLEVKKSTNSENFIKKLYATTPLKENFNVNSVALVDGEPKVLSLREIVMHFAEFQKEIYSKKHRVSLDKITRRLEILFGMNKAKQYIKAIVRTMEVCETDSEVEKVLMNGDVSKFEPSERDIIEVVRKFDFTENQAKAIMDMKLRQLMKLEVEKIADETKKLEDEKVRLENILENEDNLVQDIINSLEDIKKDLRKNLGDLVERRTEIIDETIEKYTEQIDENEMYLVIDRFGYAKLVNLSSFGKMKKESYKVAVKTTNLDRVYLYGNDGIAYGVDMKDIPKSKASDKGILINSLIDGKNFSEIKGFVSYKDIEKDGGVIVIVTKGKKGKFVAVEDLRTRNRKILFTKLAEDDEVVKVEYVSKEDFDLDLGSVSVEFGNKSESVEFIKLKVQGRNTQGKSIYSKVSGRE